MIVKVFSGIARPKAGANISFFIPKKYARITGFFVTSDAAGKVELSLSLEKIGSIIQRGEYESKPSRQSAFHRVSYSLREGNQLKGVVRSLTGQNQNVKVFIMLEK